MEELYTNNNELLIKYIDSESGQCLTTQQTAIAAVILQALTFCNYITISGIDYIVLESKLALSKDVLDKNVYEVYVENVENYIDDINEEHFEEE